MKLIFCKQENSRAGPGQRGEKGDTKRFVPRSLTGSCLALELFVVRWHLL